MAAEIWRAGAAQDADGPAVARRDARRLGVLRSGVTLMLAFAAGYAAWSALVAAFPAAATHVLNALFHGVDFGKLDLEGETFSLVRLGIGTGLWAVKGLVFGVVFAAIYNALGRREDRDD